MLSLFVIIFFMITSASSWGPKTNEYICQQAVTKVWSEEAFLNCFVSTRIDDICSLLDEGYREECLRLTVMPWSIVDDVYNDSEKWHDYSLCHVSGNAGKTLCGDKSFTPAGDEANEWFIKARNYANECMRMYAFCIGGNYYAKRFFQPYQLKYDNPKCEAYLNGKVEEYIGKNKDWKVHTRCNYEFWTGVGQKRRITEDVEFIVKQYKIDDIITELVDKGNKISVFEGEIGEPLPAVISSTSTTSTTIAKTTTSTTTVVKAAASTTTVVKVVETSSSTTSSSTSSSTVYAPPTPEDVGEDAAAAIVIEESKTYSNATFAILFVVLCVLIFIVFRRIMMRSRESQPEEEVEVEPVKKKEDYSLQDIKGLSRVAEDRLKSVGICSLKKLIETDASEISAETEISEERITEWKKKAGDMLK